MITLLSYLQSIEAIPYLRYLLPAFVIGFSIAISRVLKLPLAIVLLGGAAPCVLVWLNLGLSEAARQQHPLVIISALWLVLLFTGLGFVLARTLGQVANNSSGGLSLVSLVVLLASVGVVGALFFKPSLLESDGVAAWRTPLIILLGACTLLGFVLTTARMVKNGIMLVVWGLLCLTLASEAFFNRLPTAVLGENLKNLSSFVPARIARAFPSFAKTTEPVVKIAFLGGAVSAPLAVSEHNAFPARLESMLNAHHVKPGFELLNVSDPGYSVYQRREALLSQVIPEKPAMVLISGWYSDAEQGANVYGQPGLSEAEAYDRVKFRSWLSFIPGVDALWQSRALRAAGLSIGLISEEPETVSGGARVPPGEYESILRAMVKEVKGGGALPVLIHEPVERGKRSDSEEEYRKAESAVANEEGLKFVDLTEVLEEHRQDELFTAQATLSASGHRLVAEALYREIIALAPEQGAAQQEGLATALHQISQFPDLSVSQVALRKDMTGDLLFRLGIPEDRKGFYRVLFSVNDRYVEDRRLNDKGAVNVRFRVPEEYRAFPAVKWSLQLVPSPQGETDRIGSSEFFAPIELAVDSAQESKQILAAGEVIGEDAGPSTIFTALDGNSGALIERQILDSSDQGLEALATELRRLPWGTIVAIGGENAVPGSSLNPETSRALRYIGLDSQLLIPGKFAAIGVTGAKSGTAMIKQDPVRAMLALGDRLPELTRFRFEGKGQG